MCLVMSHRIQGTAEIQDRYPNHLLQLLLIGLLKFERFVLTYAPWTFCCFFEEGYAKKRGFLLGQCNGSRLLHIQMKSDFLWFCFFFYGNAWLTVIISTYSNHNINSYTKLFSPVDNANGKVRGALNSFSCIRLRYLRVRRLPSSSSLRHGKRVPR